MKCAFPCRLASEWRVLPLFSQSYLGRIIEAMYDQFLGGQMLTSKVLYCTVGNAFFS
jgi:hypothetical protein